MKDGGGGGGLLDMIFGSFRYGRHLPPELDFGCCLCAAMMGPSRFRTKWPRASFFTLKRRDQLVAVLPGCKNIVLEHWWNSKKKKDIFTWNFSGGIRRLWTGVDFWGRKWRGGDVFMKWGSVKMSVLWRLEDAALPFLKCAVFDLFWGSFGRRKSLTDGVRNVPWTQCSRLFIKCRFWGACECSRRLVTIAQSRYFELKEKMFVNLFLKKKMGALCSMVSS